MYYAEIDLPIETIRAQREASRKAPDRMADYMQNVVRPEIQTLVQNTLAIYPGNVVHPFEFATAKSRRWYFANMVPRNSRTGQYARTNKLKQAWQTILDRRRNEGLLAVRNTDPAAIYVLGARQVPGHRRTGWAAEQEQQLAQIADAGVELIAEGWYIILSEAE